MLEQRKYWVAAHVPVMAAENAVIRTICAV
jgi:hypothetical protein